MPARPDEHGAVVTVVSGLPRSGTSMMMRMLTAGGLPALADSVRPADEDNPKGYFELDAVKRLGESDDLSWLEGARGRVVKVVSPLLEALPTTGYRYKVLFMRRHLREILASQAAMLTRRGEPHDPASDETMFGAFVAHLEQVQGYLRSQPCFEVEHFFYREMLGAPKEQARRAATFVGVELDLDLMAAAVDPSLWRNRADG